MYFRVNKQEHPVETIFKTNIARILLVDMHFVLVTNYCTMLPVANFILLLVYHAQEYLLHLTVYNSAKLVSSLQLGYLVVPVVRSCRTISFVN